jgi:flagellar biosynthesis anti-sigma factor FlgM
MKVHNHPAGFDAITTVRNDQTDAAPTPAVGRKDRKADEVKLSSGAQLANAAIGAAGEASDIRRDKVERAKALLLDGKLAQDPVQLADAIIDRVIDGD